MKLSAKVIHRFTTREGEPFEPIIYHLDRVVIRRYPLRSMIVKDALAEAKKKIANDERPLLDRNKLFIYEIESHTARAEIYCTEGFFPFTRKTLMETVAVP